MIRVLLFGALGRMGREIALSAKRFEDIEIVKMVDIVSDSGKNDFSSLSGVNGYEIEVVNDTANGLFMDVDCAVEFTRHDVTVKHLEMARKWGIPYVIGTTGFTVEERKRISEYAKGAPVFLSSNMSRGINVINAILGKLTENFSDYDAEIWEMHHREKKDAPSGTALMLAATIRETFPERMNIVKGRMGIDSKRNKGDISISSIRGGDIFGEHHILFAGDGESIEIVHRATGRRVFADGAIEAIKFIINRENGLYSFKDMLKV